MGFKHSRGRALRTSQPDDDLALRAAGRCRPVRAGAIAGNASKRVVDMIDLIWLVGGRVECENLLLRGGRQAM